MKKQIKEKARELFENEYSPADAVIELACQVSQSTIYRWFSEFENEEFSLMGVVDELENEESLDRLPDENLETISDTIEESDTAEDDSLVNDKELLNEEVIATDQDDEVQIRKRKRALEKKMRKLFNAILSHCDGHEWQKAQINSMLLSLGNAQEEVEDLFSYDPELYRSNAIWVALESYIDLFQAFSNAGGPVVFSFYDDQLLELEAILGIEQFDEEYDWKKEFDLRYDKFINDLKELNNASVNADDALAVQAKTEELIKDLSEYDPDSKELVQLKNIRRGTKQLLLRIEDSFWGTAKYVFDEDLELA